MLNVRSLLVLTLILTACAPRSTPVPLLSALPPETLTALAPTPTIARPTETPRPTAQPTQTRPPRPSETPTEPATPTPTPGPVVVEAVAPHLTPFGAGTVLHFASIQTFTGGFGWGLAEPRLDRDDHVVVTRDGGFHWRDVTPPQPASMELESGWAGRFFALTSEMAWAVFYDRKGGALPEQAWVWRTADAGTTWQTSFALDLGDSIGFIPLDLHFSDASTGWLLIADAPERNPTSRRLLTTDDGGLHWSTLVSWSSLTGEACEAQVVRRLSATDGYLFASCPGALDQQSLLRVTHDGGSTWEPVSLPRPKGFPASFDGRCAATPEWVAGEDVTLRVDCRANDTGALGQFLLRSTPDSASGFSVAAFGQTQLLDAAFYGPGEALLLIDPRPDRVDDLHVLRTADAGLNTQRQRAVRWMGFLEAAGADQVWAVLSTDADSLYVSADGGQSWGRTDAVIVE